MDKTFHKKSGYLAIVIIAGIIVTACCYFNCNIYHSPIGKVSSIQTREEGRGANKKTIQTIKLQMVNGDNKGSKVTGINVYEASLAYGEKYSKGDFLFLSRGDADETADNANHTYNVAGQKRDYYIAGLMSVLLCLLIVIGGHSGILTIIGMIINCSLFSLGFLFFGKSSGFLWVTVGMMLFFTTVILVMVGGFRRETLATVLATLATVATIGVLAAIAIYFGPRIHYEFFDFLPEPYTLSHANALFLSEILIGALGAVMDIAVTIVAATKEVLAKNPMISHGELMSSVRKISDDITGLMINVVFFTNVAVLIPIMYISMKNDIDFFTVIRNNGVFEIMRFLTGAIGIVAAIPLSTFIGAKVLQGYGKIYEDGRAK